MRRALPLVLLIAGCDPNTPKPTEAEMDRVEAALAKSPCVGRLADLHRRYFYLAKYANSEVLAAYKEKRTPRPNDYIVDIVEIDLRPANFWELKTGRDSYAVPPFDRYEYNEADIRSRRIVVGSYTLSDGDLRLSAC